MKNINDFIGEFTIIYIALSHQELANMIGATRESVTSTLNELAKEEAIVTGRISISLRKEILSAFQ